MEWLLEEAASRAAQTSWARMGYRRATEARALILRWYRRRMGITVVRAMARHRWRVAPLAVRGTDASAARALQAEGGPGVSEAGEGAGGAPLGGGSEDGAGALLPVASGVVSDRQSE